MQQLKGRFHNSEFHIEIGAIDIHDKKVERDNGNRSRAFSELIQRKKVVKSSQLGWWWKKSLKRKIDPDFAEGSVISLIISNAIVFSDVFAYFLLFLQPNAPELAAFPERTQFCSEPLA